MEVEVELHYDDGSIEKTVEIEYREVEAPKRFLNYDKKHPKTGDPLITPPVSHKDVHGFDWRE